MDVWLTNISRCYPPLVDYSWTYYRPCWRVLLSFCAWDPMGLSALYCLCVWIVIKEFLDFWIFGFLDFWIFGFLHFWIFGFLDFEFLDFWIFEFLDFWIFRPTMTEPGIPENQKLGNPRAENSEKLLLNSPKSSFVASLPQELDFELFGRPVSPLPPLQMQWWQWGRCVLDSRSGRIFCDPPYFCKTFRHWRIVTPASFH